ncbi:MAG TPA: hypothetical protein VI431_02460 [Candidatus Acidoferrum sp.]
MPERQGVGITFHASARMAWGTVAAICLAGARAERASSQRTRPHPETPKRGRYVAEKIPAARATTVVSKGTGDIDAQPVPARFTKRVDALDSQAGQVLHRFTSKAAVRPANGERQVTVDLHPSPLHCRLNPAHAQN